MPVSGIVVTLKQDEDAVAETLRAFGDDTRIDVGDRNRDRLPLVLDTADSDEDKELWRWINSQPGVIHTDVVFVHFDEEVET